MNVQRAVITAVHMHIAKTQQGASTVLVSMDTWEMDPHAVSKYCCVFKLGSRTCK